ncbi:SRPBCC family protein [Martelella mediterranea]|uniref:SRPBCC family protein n=1 Tax=Martelella mediterranea TaxID=293089 RepID=UPI001E43F958|nr:SRPBCC family protein [Martelella mediterranea]MCD1636651.1 SRPBCC family protein [Martelella mediterranea]
MPEDSLEVAVDASLTPEACFKRFTEGMTGWWPKAYTWSGEALVKISITPKVGGPCSEIGPHGFRSDFGRVLAVHPGKSVRFTWQISMKREPVPDPAMASRVDVRFSEIDADTTRVVLIHSAFANHGEGFEAYRDAMASEQGWPLILDCFNAPA